MERDAEGRMINDDLTEMARDRRKDWERSIEWATGAAKRCENPSTIALLLAMRQEYLLIDFDRFTRRVREMTARIEMERLSDEMARCSERCTRLSTADAGKQGLEQIRAIDRYMRESKRWDALREKYDAAQERWSKELGI
jgi:hypothetical protein